MSEVEQSDQYEASVYNPAPSGHPKLATAVCLFLLLVSLGNGEPATIEPGENRLAYILGSISGHTIFAAMLWGIAFAITIRRSSRGWRIGSLLTVLLVGTSVGFAQVGRGLAVEREDIAEAARRSREFLANPSTHTPAMTGSEGPATGITMELLHRFAADRQAFERDSDASGVEKLFNLDGVNSNRDVVGYCDPIAKLVDRAGYYGRQWRPHLAAVRAAAERRVRDGDWPAEAVEQVFGGLSESQLKYEQIWRLNSEVVVQQTAICRILATKPWVKQGPDVKFANTSDAEQFNFHLEGLQRLAEELSRQKQAASNEAQSLIRATEASR